MSIIRDASCCSSAPDSCGRYNRRPHQSWRSTLRERGGNEGSPVEADLTAWGQLIIFLLTKEWLGIIGRCTRAFPPGDCTQTSAPVFGRVHNFSYGPKTSRFMCSRLRWLHRSTLMQGRPPLVLRPLGTNEREDSVCSFEARDRVGDKFAGCFSGSAAAKLIWKVNNDAAAVLRMYSRFVVIRTGMCFHLVLGSMQRCPFILHV